MTNAFSLSLQFSTRTCVVAGDKNTIHPILYWLLSNLEALSDLAYRCGPLVLSRTAVAERAVDLHDQLSQRLFLMNIFSLSPDQPDISECDLTFRRPSDQGKRAYLAKFCMNLEVQLLRVSEVNQT